MAHAGPEVLSPHSSPAGIAAAAGGAVRLRQSRRKMAFVQAGLAIVFLCALYMLAGGAKVGMGVHVFNGALLGIVTACVLFKDIRQSLRDARRGHVLGVDSKGIHYRHLPRIPWGAVRSLEVRQVRAFLAGRSYPYLAVGVDGGSLQPWEAALQRNFLDPIVGHVDKAESMVFLALSVLECPPDDVLRIVELARSRHQPRRPAPADPVEGT